MVSLKVPLKGLMIVYVQDFRMLIALSLLLPVFAKLKVIFIALALVKGLSGAICLKFL